jgi:serine/threonine protein kinase
MKKKDITGLSEDEIKKYRKEAVALFELKHAGIVQYIDHVTYVKSVGRETRKYYGIIMEYAEQGNLKKWLAKRTEPLDEPWALEFFAEICIAIMFCHKNKVLHRDLQPKNIFMAWNYRLQVGNFGSSKMLDATMGHAMTMTNSSKYRAPEVRAGRTHSPVFPSRELTAHQLMCRSVTGSHTATLPTCGLWAASCTRCAQGTACSALRMFCL